MCGIVGFINCGSEKEMSNSIVSINHRGPDSNGIKWFEQLNSGLGHARLSIIDLSQNAIQPMFDKNNQNYIVFNGEIYNYKEIKNQLENAGYTFFSNSDTEVILHAYDKWGEECLNMFNGMFAFCIYNQITGNTFIARDRLGIKPLYYYTKGDKLAFSSEIKAILKLEEYEQKPDLIALQTPIHYQVGPYTGFKNIYKLPPGCYINFNKKGLLIKRYWDIIVSEEEISEKHAIESLDYLINDAVKLNLVSDIPVGVMLSGGLDSSILSALMQSNMTNPLNSFTIKFDKKDLKRQGNTDDSYFAKILAEKFGFNHNEIILKPDITKLLPKMVYHLDEPIADPSAISTYLIANAAKERGISVLLTGMGADEVFGGYRSHLACLKADTYQNFVPKPIRSLIENVVLELPESNSKRNYKYIRWLKRFIEIASLPQFERQITIKNSSLTNKNFNEYYLDALSFNHSYYYQIEYARHIRSNSSYLTKMCFSDTKSYMVDHNLTYSDKAMMAAGVEGRPTLIDHRIVEFMFKTEPKMRINGNIQKFLLKKVSEKYIPKEIIYRSKAPFSAPLRGWLKNELKEMVNDILSYDSVKARGIYNPDFVRKLIANNENGIEDNAQLIWRLMVNEIWFKTFFKN